MKTGAQRQRDTESKAEPVSEYTDGGTPAINQFTILHRQPLSEGKNLGMLLRVRRLEALSASEGLREAKASPPMWPSQRIPKQRRPAV